jgi:hypothetical protein
VIVSPGRRRVACSAVYLFLIKLSVTGGDGAFVGHHPHLHEVRGHGVLGSALHPPGVVLFRVQDSGAGAHTLGEPRVDDPGVTGGAPVDQRACNTQVTISMSWWGCVSNPVPGLRTSSLLINSRP